MNMQNKFRAFLALDIPEVLQNSITDLIKDLKKDHELKKIKCKWSKPKNIHLTLKFLGNISDEQYEQITQELYEVLKEFSPFSIVPQELIPFPPINPRMLAIGVAKNNILERIAQLLEDIAVKYGIPRGTKPFMPHITLVRFEGKCASEIKKINFSNAAFTVSAIQLYKSEPSAVGSKYTKMQSFTL